MKRPGKLPGIRVSVIGFLLMIGIVLLSESFGLAQRTDQKETGNEGFRDLRWGASFEQASKIYQDLSFERYVISGGKEEPRKVYVRMGEQGDIENVTFDSIEYWFKGDQFYQIRAVLRSRIGPRTMVTRAENAFRKMNDRLKDRYGNPSDQKVDYVTEFIAVVREATWLVDHSATTIKYNGAGKTDEDSFILTMQEKPKR